ncbi:MAG TPA: hypothetical protein VF708_07755 [Pyrinomonadaceae bacterium]|jgi:hypothetical protein
MISETVTQAPPPNNRQSDFAQALMAKGPAAQLGEAASVYAWLIGSWDVRVIDYGDDGTKRESTGEWHFAWVLEGRAMQDVWISPPRSQRDSSPPQPGNRCGTTLRVYDAGIGAWRMTWNNPVSGAHDELTGRRKGSDVVQEGRDREGNLIRWVFTDITRDTFRWYGEQSLDGGKTWRLGAEFFGKRRQ